VLYGLGITYKGGYYNPFLLRFYFWAIFYWKIENHIIKIRLEKLPL
jgi:hypothetical protein